MLYRKTISFGKIAYTSKGKTNLVEVEIEVKPIGRAGINWETLEEMPEDSPTVSLCGNIWNAVHSDCVSCGQNLDEIVDNIRTKKMKRIHEIWKRYHLNDMKTGTKKQTEALDELKKTGWKYDYTEACICLTSIGLLEDRGYRYGHGWLYMPVPDEVIEELKSF